MKLAVRCSILLSVCCLLLACGPDPDYIDSRGNSGHFSDHRGKWLVVNYWAVWCKPCVEEIPELNTLAETLRQQVSVLGVDFDNSPPDKLATSIDKLDIRFPVLTANPATRLGVQTPSVLPTTYIFDPEGALHATLRGPQTLASLRAAMGLDGSQ